MNRAASLALLLAGIILVACGFGSSSSLGSGFSRFFGGAPTNRTIWLLVGGSVAAVTGLAGLCVGTRAE